MRRDWEFNESGRSKIYFNVHNLNRRNRRSIRFFSLSNRLISAGIELQAWELNSFSRWPRKTCRLRGAGKRYELRGNVDRCWYYWHKLSKGGDERKVFGSINWSSVPKKKEKKEKQIGGKKGKGVTGWLEPNHATMSTRGKKGDDEERNGRVPCERAKRA